METKTRKQNIENNLNNTIDLINKKIELLQEEKSKLLLRKQNLQNYDYFTKKETKELLEYLVSKKEQEKYLLETLDFNIKSTSYNKRNIVSQYTLLYLVSENNKENAIDEIKKNYNISIINNENYILRRDINNEIESNSYYTKLSFYSRYGDYKVKFGNKNEAGIISININDERFKYISDFINMVLDKRLGKKDFKLTLVEMKQIADEFIDDETYSKKITKKILY